MPRNDVMRYLLLENLSICVGRQGSVIGSNNYNIIFISDKIVDFNLYRRGGELVFPLYIYPERPEKKKFFHSQMMMFEPTSVYQVKQPNIKPELFEELRTKYKKEVTPEEIFYYIYAVLYSNTYRVKYAEFLKMDFPRIPFTDEYKTFIKLGKFGKQLADLHLLKSKELEKPIAKFPIEGNNKVEKPIFELRDAEKQPVVYINKEQYFKGVTEEIWQYQIGGYQVCEKWLKDRKRRVLSLDEITTYCKIVTALSKTIELQKEIDELYKLAEIIDKDD
jgi:predicted helicase